MLETPPYRMSISLNVLNHLGIGLYSNVPAVLSEVVANAWDADAQEVSINIDQVRHEITVIDDGRGMTRAEVNNRYLNVGYQKRIQEPGLTPGGRVPMGRKGIGKLSVFSIADTIELYTTRSGERCALSLNAKRIKEQIEHDEAGTYFPTPLDPAVVDLDKGTKIVLRDLRKNVAASEGFLRRRLARRFSIIGPKHRFNVILGGRDITAKDRGYHDKIEFLWYFGDIDDAFLVKDHQDIGILMPSGKPNLLPSLKRATKLPDVVDGATNRRVSGWIGTVDEQKNIDEENNAIVIMAHGKLVQEDLLKDLKEAGIYSTYVIGEIDADYMDDDEEEDIVTSDRQSVKEDDPRYPQLKEFIRGVLKKVQGEWTDLRRDLGAQRALANPTLNKWYGALRGDNQKYARHLFGKIESLNLPDPSAKKELYKASLLGFETLALKNQLSILESVETEQDFLLLTQIFQGIDDIEAVHYYQIAKGRIQVVKEFEKVLPDAKERLIQQHIFDHLWLLDPSWERAAAQPRLEQAVETEFGKVDAGLTSDERTGRLDIRYRTAAGKYIIIELKKFDRRVDVYDLAKQVNKYQSALQKVLQAKLPSEAPFLIESICVLGSPPEPHASDKQNREILKANGARYITYDELIAQTRKSYEDYIEREKQVSELITLIEELDSTYTEPASLPL